MFRHAAAPRDDESTCEYVSSVGILKSCDLHSVVPHVCRFTQYNRPLRGQPDYTTIYVCAGDIRTFMAEGLSDINYKFILVSGDDDNTCPEHVLPTEDFDRLVADERLVRWFSQNCVAAAHTKLTQIPIGMDYHTLSRHAYYWGPRQSPLTQESAIKRIAAAAAPYWERAPKIYSNWHFLIDTRYARVERTAALAEIPADLIYYEPAKLSREETYRRQCEYAFVVSPQGNGMDCHRTWESLILGNIVIVRTSPLDALFADLPVYVVQQWSDINAELLTEIARDFRTRKFRFDKLTLNYWVGLFREAAAAPRSYPL